MKITSCLRQEKVYEGLNTNGKHYHSSMLGSISESANDESPKSECSVCPIPQVSAAFLYCPYFTAFVLLLLFHNALEFPIPLHGSTKHSQSWQLSTFIADVS